MRNAFVIILGLAAGYLAGAAIGAALVTLFSDNRHDKAIETVMTAAFVTGPLGAILAGIALFLRR